jgi:hypothetical protein
VIVRISGSGQFELNDESVQKLQALDIELMQAVDAHNEQRFHELMGQIVSLVRGSGKPVDHSRVLPSELIVPPEDITMDEAHRFFTDDGLMTPIPA